MVAHGLGHTLERMKMSDHGGDRQVARVTSVEACSPRELWLVSTS
jgi:hypothetical protein